MLLWAGVRLASLATESLRLSRDWAFTHKMLKLAQRNMFEPADSANASAMLVLSWAAVLIIDDEGADVEGAGSLGGAPASN